MHTALSRQIGDSGGTRPFTISIARIGSLLSDISVLRINRRSPLAQVQVVLAAEPPAVRASAPLPALVPGERRAPPVEPYPYAKSREPLVAPGLHLTDRF